MNMLKAAIFVIFLLCTCQAAVAQPIPSSYTFAKTKQMLVDEQHTEMGKIMNSAGSYLEALQTRRGLNLGLGCAALAAISYLFSFAPAAFAFGAIAAFVLLINQPLIGSCVILPIIIYRWTKLKDPAARPVYFKNGAEVLPESVKERKSERLQGQINPIKDAATAAAPVNAPKIARPI